MIHVSRSFSVRVRANELDPTHHRVKGSGGVDFVHFSYEGGTMPVAPGAPCAGQKHVGMDHLVQQRLLLAVCGLALGQDASVKGDSEGLMTVAQLSLTANPEQHRTLRSFMGRNCVTQQHAESVCDPSQSRRRAQGHGKDKTL